MINELKKLKLDTQKFCEDHGLTSRLGFLKLAIVIDYWPVIHYRLHKYSINWNNPLSFFLRIFMVLLKPFVQGLSGCRISTQAEIGSGFLLHQSSGVVIASGSVIGTNCTIFSGVCVVYKANSSSGEAPRIGQHVKLMVGCKLVGDIVIGDNVLVGANAVVLSDVPENSIAVGIPAKVKPRNRLL